MSVEQVVEKILADQKCGQLNHENVFAPGANFIGKDLRHAILKRANLRDSYFRGADLRGADLSEANLTNIDLRGTRLDYANLQGADLSRANLISADLRCTNLSQARLNRANLIGVDLRLANLSGANLTQASLATAYLNEADLSEANLDGANLAEADLEEANLHGISANRTIFEDAKLSGAQSLPPFIAARLMRCPPEGEFIGWKKCSNEQIIKLLIPADAKRSSAASNKCRASYVIVLEGNGISFHDHKTHYRPGARVECDEWDEDRWKQCTGGIHFFMFEEEARTFHFN